MRPWNRSPQGGEQEVSIARQLVSRNRVNAEHSTGTANLVIKGFSVDAPVGKLPVYRLESNRRPQRDEPLQLFLG